MSGDFVRNLTNGIVYKKVSTQGYDGEELKKIARLYDVIIKGQFASFLSEMGRDSGGLFGDHMIPLYHPHWYVREHLGFQECFFRDMQDCGKFEYLNKPFVFSCIAETQYYFLQTALGDSDCVYHFDSNDDVVRKTEFDLLGFLRFLLKGDKDGPYDSVGDLLEI